MFGLRQKTFEQVKLELPFNEIRKRARILVINDDKEAFPYNLMQKEGYNVQYWQKVENLHDLENGEFDIIVLDIFGVATAEMSTNNGLGILEHLKKHNPAQLVSVHPRLHIGRAGRTPCAPVKYALGFEHVVDFFV
jgi:hypothetical protein